MASMEARRMADSSSKWKTRVLTLVGAAGLLFGIPSALNIEFFRNQDWVWGVGLMLSGGERALTSIALIFAVSQVNPPPFIILDETDAALDEATHERAGAVAAYEVLAFQDAPAVAVGLGNRHPHAVRVVIEGFGRPAVQGVARRGEHGGGGILTISVKGEGRDALTMALIDEGFEVKVES